MKEIIAILDQRAAEFDELDWGIFKCALILTGIIIGATFQAPCKALRPLLFLVWICCFTYMILRIFVIPELEEA